MWIKVKNDENETVYVNLNNVAEFDVEANALFLNTVNCDRNGVLRLSSESTEKLSAVFDRLCQHHVNQLKKETGGK